MELFFLAMAFFMGGFGVELVLRKLTRGGRKLLRLLPLGAAVWLWTLSWRDYHAAFLTGLSQLAAFAEAVAGLLVVLGFALACYVDRPEP